jgi:hypothetical protein
MPIGTGGAFFRAIPDGWFVATDAARGPWDADACHAGPATGLLARAVEGIVPDKQLTRLTVEVTRPIPMAGFRIEADLTRSGRTAAATAAVLTAADGSECAVASGLHLVAGDIGPVPTPPFAVPSLEEATPGPFPVREARHDLTYFAGAVEVRYPPGESPAAGPTFLWMRTIPLLDTEEPSPFQRLCPLADCGNGIARNAELAEVTFVNPDLTVTMHRPPVGEWLASDALSHWQSTGIGVAHATLFDSVGPVGTATQTVLLQRTRNDPI